MLKYRCSRSDKEVTTSIRTDVVTLLEMRNLKLSVWCPHCVTAHQIWANDAYIGDDEVAIAAE